jgi:Tfp pilus assembly pilus retraction ATPase PilT
MQTLDQSLRILVNYEKIALAEARSKAKTPESFSA